MSPANEDRDLLERMYWAAVRAADPARRIVELLPTPPKGRTIIIGAGKASAQMAKAVERAWSGPLSGLVVVPYGSNESCGRIELLEAAHPVPDAAGLSAAERIFGCVRGLSTDDLVIALISGGGSSLLPAPASGLTLEDERSINRALLQSGAGIGDMNLIRNQFSRIKGGRLAAACAPARVVTFVVSDVPGDDPSIVASGPTVPQLRGRQEARKLVSLYGIELPSAATALLASEENLPPSPRDPGFADHEVYIVASAAASLQAAMDVAAAEGLACHILSDSVEGEASAIGQMHAAIAREVFARGRPFIAPCVLLSGGETTVTVRGNGMGGRNTEFLLAFAEGISGLQSVAALAADTDGIDGRGENAGAFCDGSSIERMRRAGIDPRNRLRSNDSGTAFAALNDLFVTGPTGTNVNDFRAILIR